MKTKLKMYYESLPQKSTISPKNDFLFEVASKCGVSFGSVRNWIYYGQPPRKEEHKRILSELTGIPVNELFKDED